jgi:hypothetical protein
MYDQIYGLCGTKNLGNCTKNGVNPTPRVKFLCGLLDKLGIEYYLDEFPLAGRKSWDNKAPEETTLFNIVIPGSSGRMVVAHHDIVNPSADNANDNSASCINAIALKRMVPELSVIIFDGEEIGGVGSAHAADQIVAGDHGNIEWVLNLELTGRGGDKFFIGNYPGALSDKIVTMFDCPIFNTPFNDSVTLRARGIDSTVINPLPALETGKSVPHFFEPVTMDGVQLDTSILMNCHSTKDSLSTISTDDMKVFVERVLYKIVTS